MPNPESGLGWAATGNCNALSQDACSADNSAVCTTVWAHELHVRQVVHDKPEVLAWSSHGAGCSQGGAEVAVAWVAEPCVLHAVSYIRCAVLVGPTNNNWNSAQSSPQVQARGLHCAMYHSHDCA